MHTCEATGQPANPPMGRAEAWLVRANQALIIGLMAVMAVLVFVNVVTRYVFNHSIIWVEELTQYQMIWITYLGAGLALRRLQATPFVDLAVALLVAFAVIRLAVYVLRSILPEGASGWDWIGVNLHDGGSLMAFQMRGDDVAETQVAKPASKGPRTAEKPTPRNPVYDLIRHDVQRSFQQPID